MEKLPVEELNLLSKELDIFKNTSLPESEIINLHLYPPLPVAGGYLVWGFHLLKKAMKMGVKHLFAVSLPEQADQAAGAGQAEQAAMADQAAGARQAALPAQKKLEFLKLSLKLEARTGKYLWEEKESMVKFIGDLSLFGNEIIALIEGKENPGFVKNFSEYISLRPALKELVVKGDIDIKTASRLKELPDEVFLLLEKYKKNKKLSFSSKRILLTQFLDIVKRDKLQKEQLISLFKDILSRKDPVSETGYIRYPELTNLGKRFESVKMNILTGTGVKLEAPPNFEGDSYSIAFNFKNKKQLSRKIAVLKELESHADELFKLL